MALRGVWEMMLGLWLCWAWRWVTSTEACCLFQKRGLCHKSWQRAALALLPVGSGGPGAGCCTAAPWGLPDLVMLDKGNGRRGRLGGARDADRAADT